MPSIPFYCLGWQSFSWCLHLFNILSWGVNSSSDASNASRNENTANYLLIIYKLCCTLHFFFVFWKKWLQTHTGNIHLTQNLIGKFAPTLRFQPPQPLSGNQEARYEPSQSYTGDWSTRKQACSAAVLSWMSLRWTHSGHHLQMLLRAAEVLGQVVHAEVFMLAGVNPRSVLLRVWDPVQEDPKSFPDGFLTNWR